MSFCITPKLAHYRVLCTDPSGGLCLLAARLDEALFSGEFILKYVINRLATPLTAGLFLVSLVSGVALFLHVAQGTFHEMHEWLSMLLVLPFILHLVKNWNGLMGYRRYHTLIIPILICVIIAIPFAWMGSGKSGGGNANGRIARVLTQSSLTTLAPVFKTTPQDLAAHLTQAGYTVTSNDETINDIATAAGDNPMKVLQVLVPSGK